EMRVPSGSKFKVRLSVVPTIQRYEGVRIRTQEEIAFDLTNVAFDVIENTSSVREDGTGFSFGCQYEKIRPSVDLGVVRLQKTGCARTFAITLIPAGVGLQDATSLEASGRMMASALLETRGQRAVALQVEMRSVNLPNAVNFIVERVH
ncbi:MAG: hypothetical protein AAB250_07010, partial [Bdellovibrionota bacterium]